MGCVELPTVPAAGLWAPIGPGLRSPQTPAPTTPSSSSRALNHESLENRDRQQPSSKEAGEPEGASDHELI